MSQLDLGLTADVSARHISFLETGRSKPSRAMVLHLCEELGVPRAYRNRMLNQAGLAPAYESRNLDNGEMEPVRLAIDWMLQRHNPFPAMAIDRHWTIVRLNRTAHSLLTGLGLEEGANMPETLISSSALRDAVVNLDQVMLHLRHRLKTESAHYGGDETLDRYEKDLGKLNSDSHKEMPGLLPPFVPTLYRFGETTLSLFSTFAQFGTAEDIALKELKIEMMFPADDETRETLIMLDGSKSEI